MNDSDASTSPRLARIESDIAHLRADVGDIKQDIRDIRSEMREFRNSVDAKFDSINAKFDGKFDALKDSIASAKIWALLLYVSFAAVMLGVMARGFKWL